MVNAPATLVPFLASYTSKIAPLRVFFDVASCLTTFSAPQLVCGVLVVRSEPLVLTTAVFRIWPSAPSEVTVVVMSAVTAVLPASLPRPVSVKVITALPETV